MSKSVFVLQLHTAAERIVEQLQAQGFAVEISVSCLIQAAPDVVM